jgi:hypothetical protein
MDASNLVFHRNRETLLEEKGIFGDSINAHPSGNTLVF